MTWFSIMVISVGVVTQGCSSSANPSAAILPKVIFHTKPADVPVSVEICADPESRNQGLMFRKHLEPGHGMLFLFPQEDIQTFWMKNTLIPLDMIFINGQHQVVGIVAKAEPLTLTGRQVEVPSQYVVEVPGGFAEQYGIVSGTRVTFPNITPKVN